MTTKAKFPGNTIQLSDTVDQWGPQGSHQRSQRQGDSGLPLEGQE